MSQYTKYTFDAALVLKAGGAVTVATDAPILDIGDGYVEGDIVIDLAAIDAAGYTVSVEGSNVPAMTSGSVCLGRKTFGAIVVPMDAALTALGRYVICFRNEENGQLYRYIRLSIAAPTGVVTTGINFSSFVGIE